MILAASFLPLVGAAWIPAPTPVNPVLQLQNEIAAGRELTFESGHGYLKSVLERLKIDPNSQTLVFSKTSLQSDYITRKTPRAIYFNDSTYVGWIPGAPLIEIATIDPEKGVVFYTLENKKSKGGAFEAESNRCNRCHGSRDPQLFAQSVFTAPSGYPRVLSPEYRATPALPFEQRWGGWYVTGQHGALRHMGNEIAEGNDEKYRIDTEKGANRVDLSATVDLKRYLTPYSDIVALMAMESQMEIQNAMSAVKHRPSDERVERLVEALLGSGEVALPGPIKGTGSFALDAPKDHAGRSLGDLDLRTRLLKYPCSPLVYSAGFAHLPDDVRQKVWRRMDQVLSGQDPSEAYRHLSGPDRQAVREILRETRPEFAAVSG